MSLSGPITLLSLKKGQYSNGDSGSDPTVLPDWMDRERFRRGQRFYAKHTFTLASILYGSFMLGTSVKSVLEPLVFTGKSSTPGKALLRFFNTFLHYRLWHTEDVWDVNSRGHKSLMEVRRMHKNVRRMMHKLEGGEIQRGSQYDMALVQAGLICPPVMYYRQLGWKTTPEELEDYIFFWRGIGYLLGMEDEYNVCTRVTYEETCALGKEVEKMVASFLLNPSKEYLNFLQTALKALHILSSVESTISFGIELTGNDFWLNQRKLSFADKCRVNFYKLIFWCMRSVPGFEIFVNYVFHLIILPFFYLVVKLLK